MKTDYIYMLVLYIYSLLPYNFSNLQFFVVKQVTAQEVQTEQHAKFFCNFSYINLNKGNQPRIILFKFE